MGDLGSPYEAWTKRFNDKNTTTLADQIFKENLHPTTFKILQEPFYLLAKDSNENFFSKDTILDQQYISPTIDVIGTEKLSDNSIVTFGYQGVNNTKTRLLRVDRMLGGTKTIYSLIDDDNLILNDYWTHLSKQAVLNGAGIVRLFLEEADKERQSKMRLFQNRSWHDDVASLWNSVFGGSEAQDPEPLISALPDGAFDENRVLAVMPKQEEAPPKNNLNDQAEPTANISNIVTNILPPPLSDIPKSETSNSIIPSITQTTSENLFSVTPGAGGGAGFVSPNNEQTQPSVAENPAPQSNNDANNPQTEHVPEIPPVPSDTTPPPVPKITEPVDNTIVTKNEITFRGTAEPSSLISQDVNSDTATTGSDGMWKLKLLMSAQGTSTINFYATDGSNNTSSSSPVTIFIDTIVPEMALNIAQCDRSLSPDSCLAATSAIDISWSSSAADIDHYKITCMFNGISCKDFDFANTRATSTLYKTSDGEGLYELRAQAFDTAGNTGEERVKEIYISNTPVVINEIAWSGTPAGSNDEWIELYNRTDKTVSLDNMVLYAKTNKPYIPLAGAIAPRAYYLLERIDDSAVNDVTADLVYGNDGTNWALNNNPADVLVLSYASTTIDETPACSGGRSWCAGSSDYQYLSMERIDYDVTGTNMSNWKNSMSEFIKNGTDAKGKTLNATPKARNSANYLVSPNGSLASDKILMKRNSPYVIDRGGLTLEAGKTLTIEPGAVIKFVSANEPTFYVKGTLKAFGTAEDPIVFTSFYDDEYGGDTNNDGICDKTNPSPNTTCPFVGSWRRIHLSSSSVGSEFDHTIFRYGGRWFNDGLPRSMVAIEKTDVTISNSIFEYSSKHGLSIAGGSGGIFSGNVFQHNNVDADSAGLLMMGNALITNNTFTDNYIGLDIQSGASTVENNIFAGNKSYAMTISSGLNSLSGNSGSGNGKDGIVIRGQINATTSTFALHANALPYMTGSGVYEKLEIPETSSVSIDPSVVFKGQSDGIIQVSGKLNIQGDSKESVIFESPDVDGWWRGFNIAKTGLLSGGGFTVRRAGFGCPRGTPCAGLMVDGGKIDIQNARFENNYSAGMRLNKSIGSTVADVEFINQSEPFNKDNQDPTMNGTGLVITDSDIGIGRLLFSNNALGVSATRSTVTHLDGFAVDFTANIVDAIPADLFSF